MTEALAPKQANDETEDDALAFQNGCVWGCAIVAMAEAIKARYELSAEQLMAWLEGQDEPPVDDATLDRVDWVEGTGLVRANPDRSVDHG